MLEVEFAHLSDPGKVRDDNEDYIGCYVPGSLERVESHGWLFVLADGVGGHDRGEVASQTAVQAMIENYPRASTAEPMGAMMSRLVQSANSKVIETGLKVGTGKSRMATTIVAAALRYDRLQVAHVGDSRCYLHRNGKTKQLTRDHTVVAEQLAMGVITTGEAAAASTKHLLTRSLGNDLFVNVDTADHQLFAGDVLLQCSDGLHNSVEPDDISRILRNHDHMEAAAHELVDLAKERDGGDNISVQLIRVRSVERVGMYRGRPYKLR